MTFLHVPTEPSQNVSPTDVASKEKIPNVVRADSPFDQDEQVKAQSPPQTSSYPEEPQSDPFPDEDATTTPHVAIFSWNFSSASAFISALSHARHPDFAR